MSEFILEHPFFNDYANAFQARCLKELGDEGRERLKKLVCALMPSEILEMKWEGWEIGMPRPVELATEEAVNHWQEQAMVLLRDFFRRVKKGELYCDYSVITEKFAGGIERRIGKTSGLLFNLEATYWTFNIKFNKWMENNRKTYNCSLICALDEILARFDAYLREAFFPTLGPYDIGPKKRKKLEDRMLRHFAPEIRKALMKEIWE
jgi:hypothetical protein